jgi:integrase
MPRRSTGPWKRKGRGWYVTIGRKQAYLAGPEASRETAVSLWHDELAKPRRELVNATPAAEISAVEVADRYLVWIHRNRAEATAATAERYLDPWAAALPAGALAETVRPFDASEWIDLRHKKPGARRMAYRVVKAAWKWAHDSGLIEKNPLRGLKTPPGGRREITLTKPQFKSVVAAASPAMRLLLSVARLTGMRAQEVVRIEGRHLNPKTKAVEFPAAESKGKRRTRTVYLVDEAWRILQQAAKKRQTGPLLRNEDGEPWTKDAVVCNIRRIRERLEKAGKPIPGLCLTVLRHTYATDAIENGVDPLTLAELMGHKDGKMLAEVYAKMGQRSKHMRKAAKKAVGG